MAFGKRQSGVGSAAQAFNANTAAAPGYAVTESAAPTGHPFRWLIILLACGAMLYGLVVSYGPDILRDHRLAGTWQPAYDLQAMEGRCERKNFVITFCSAKIRSVANPGQAPIAHRFMRATASACSRGDSSDTILRLALRLRSSSITRAADAKNGSNRVRSLRTSSINC